MMLLEEFRLDVLPNRPRSIASDVVFHDDIEEFPLVLGRFAEQIVIHDTDCPTELCRLSGSAPNPLKHAESVFTVGRSPYVLLTSPERFADCG